MDIVLVFKVASAVAKDEPMIVADVAAVKQSIAEFKAMSKPENAEDVIAYLEKGVATLKVLAPLADQLIQQFEEFTAKQPPAAPGQ